MKTIEKIDEIKKVVKQEKTKGKIIGFIPTMGYLHEGHLSLVRESIRKTDCTVVSIFVNPAQFAPSEDFGKYPRDMQRDLKLLEKEDVDLVFIPAVKEVYPAGYKTYVEVHDLQDRLCGITRPIFFRGVCTVVLKLFHIVDPDISFFGQKDAQQAVIIEKMVQDLDMEVKIEVLPIVRDKDGLALSSRNYYFNPEQKKAALCLWGSLENARKLIAAGENDSAKIIKNIRGEIESEPKARIDYIEIVSLQNLRPQTRVGKGSLIALAVFIDKVRLIDNLIVE